MGAPGAGGAASLRALLSTLPDAATLPVGWLRDQLAADPVDAAPPVLRVERAEAEAPTWRERLWTAPAETRIGVPEAAEALGRSVDFVHRHVGPAAARRHRDRKGLPPIPSSKLAGERLFTVAALRDWIRDNEEPEAPPAATTLSGVQAQLRAAGRRG